MLAINGIEPSAFTDPIAAKTQEEGYLHFKPNQKSSIFLILFQINGEILTNGHSEYNYFILIYNMYYTWKVKT
jgi:hypothetical protein